MYVEEFLGWRDGTGTPDILGDGIVGRMAQPGQAHSRIAFATGKAIDRHPRRRCAVLSGAGLRLAADTCVQADVAVTDEPADAGRLISAPVLIVEILSPSTVKDEMGVKVPGDQELPWLREIWAIDSKSCCMREWRRIAER
jgi:Uma2 family endonuclease